MFLSSSFNYWEKETLVAQKEGEEETEAIDVHREEYVWLIN
jgi:hypothetical protein